MCDEIMKRCLGARMLGVTLAVSLSMGTITSLAFASEPSTEQPVVPVPPPIVGSINIKNKATFEVKNIQMLPEQGSNTIAFTLSFVNEGNKDLLLFDYIIKLKDKSGNVFTTRLKPQDKTITKVSPNSSQLITYYAQVNSTTKITDLILQIMEWDFTLPGYERKLGEITVPDTYTEAKPAGEKVLLSLGGIPMNMSVTSSFSSKNEKNYNPRVTLNLENMGNRSLKTAEYQFSILTSDGNLFPFDSKKDPISLRPKDSVEWKLTGSIPTSVPSEGWQLIVSEKLPGENAITTPIGVFNIADTGLGEPTESPDGAYSFSTKDGSYSAKLNGIYRAPWDDNDVLSADLTILNDEAETLPLPKLSGYFLLDDKVKVAASLVQTSQAAGIAASGGIKMHAAAVVAYDQTFTNIKFVLQEKEEAGATPEATAKLIDILEFPTQPKLKALSYYGVNDAYSISEPGRSLKYQVVGINRYEGMASDIAAIQLEVENLSKRPVSLSNLITTIRLGDGSTYPAQVSAIKKKIGPSGKAMLEIWSDLPKDFSTSSLHLIIGDAISGGKIAEGEAKPDAYIRPVAFWAPNEKKSSESITSTMDIYPYNLTIRNLSTVSESSSYELMFDYEMTKSKIVETNLEGHNLVFTMIDSTGYKLFENAYKLSEIEQGAASGGSQAGSNTLKLGKNKYKATLNVADPGNTGVRSGTLYVYDEFQGQRKLLAKQSNLALYNNFSYDKKDDDN